MANTVPSTSASAIRDVLLANNYHQSLELERWDSTEEWRTDHQFFLTGPSLVETEAVSQELHQTWGMGVHIAFAPITGPQDPDSFRFDVADAIATLQEAWHTNAVLKVDVFSLDSSDPEYNEDASRWEVHLSTVWITTRQISV